MYVCGCCDAASDHQVSGEDRKIPLLREVFAAFPNIPINVDVKVNDDRLIAEVGQDFLLRMGNISRVPDQMVYLKHVVLSRSTILVWNPRYGL